MNFPSSVDCQLTWILSNRTHRDRQKRTLTNIMNFSTVHFQQRFHTLCKLFALLCKLVFSSKWQRIKFLEVLSYICYWKEKSRQLLVNVGDLNVYMFLSWKKYRRKACLVVKLVISSCTLRITNYVYHGYINAFWTLFSLRRFQRPRFLNHLKKSEPGHRYGDA